MTDVPTIVYELALRSLDQQERELSELRARTNTVIAAAALTASFRAAAIREHGGLLRLVDHRTRCSGSPPARLASGSLPAP